MTPIDFAERTHVLGQPKDWDEAQYGICNGLPVALGEHIVSCWKPTWRERLSLLLGYPLWLVVHSRAQPPVKLLAMKSVFK